MFAIYSYSYYRLISYLLGDNWLICRLHAQCMIFNVRLCFVLWYVCHCSLQNILWRASVQVYFIVLPLLVYPYLELDIEQDEVFTVWAGAGPKKGIVNEANVWIMQNFFNVLESYDLFVWAAFVQGLFVVGGDFPFTREFDGRHHLIKEIWCCMKKITEIVVSIKSFIICGEWCSCK